MTFTRCRDRARLLSKVTTSGVSNADVNTMINEAVDAFARRVDGLPMDEYLVLTPRFDLRTTFAVHVEVTDATLGDIDTDMVVTAANADNQTGAQVATALQTAFQALGSACAGWTVAWSAYKFTITIAATTTDLEISEPTTVSYSDATELLFGGDLDFDNVSGTSLTGNFPVGSNMVMDLGDLTSKEVVKVENLYWDGYALCKVPWRGIRKGEATGEPYEWAQRGDEIAIYPTPNEQYELLLEYRGVPDDVTSVTEDVTTLPSQIPLRYQEAIVYYTAHQLAAFDWDTDLSEKYRLEFERISGQYLVNFLSNNNAPRETPVKKPWYRVVSPSNS